MALFNKKKTDSGIGLNEKMKKCAMLSDDDLEQVSGGLGEPEISLDPFGPNPGWGDTRDLIENAANAEVLEADIDGFDDV